MLAWIDLPLANLWLFFVLDHKVIHKQCQ